MWDHAICNNLDGPRECFAKWNESDWERWITWFYSYVKSKIWNKWINKKRNHAYNREQTDGC